MKITYNFSQEQLAQPEKTIADFIAQPSAFLAKASDGVQLKLSEEGKNDLLTYLSTERLQLDNFDHERNPTHLLAFSFGEDPAANELLADKVEAEVLLNPKVKLFIQWEIADILSNRDKKFTSLINRIEIEEGKNYINSVGVVRKFKEQQPELEQVRLTMVSQNWHAPRCAEIISKSGISIVKGSFVEHFPHNDPQPWIHNWLVWVVQESTKENMAARRR